MSQTDLENFALSKDVIDETFQEMGKTAQKRIGKTAQKIIDTIIENPYITRSELMERLGKADGTIKEHLSNLQASGIIQRVGPARSGYWKVLIRR